MASHLLTIIITDQSSTHDILVRCLIAIVGFRYEMLLGARLHSIAFMPLRMRTA